MEKRCQQNRGYCLINSHVHNAIVNATKLGTTSYSLVTISLLDAHAFERVTTLLRYILLFLNYITNTLLLDSLTTQNNYGHNSKDTK